MAYTTINKHTDNFNTTLRNYSGNFYTINYNCRISTRFSLELNRDRTGDHGIIDSDAVRGYTKANCIK